MSRDLVLFHIIIKPPSLFLYLDPLHLLIALLVVEQGLLEKRNGSISMSWSLCCMFRCRFSSSWTHMFTFVGSHLCLYAVLRVHAYVCEARRRMSPDICFCVCNQCVSMHICVFVNMHERTCTNLSRKGDFWLFTLCFFSDWRRTRCTQACIAAVSVYWCTCEHL